MTLAKVRHWHLTVLVIAAGVSAAFVLWNVRDSREFSMRLELVGRVRPGIQSQAQVQRLLGGPNKAFEADDFLKAFPLPGYSYVPHRPEGAVWVYLGLLGPRQATYVYFDAHGVVERVAHAVWAPPVQISDP